MGKKFIYILCSMFISVYAVAQGNFQDLIQSGNQNLINKNYKAAINDFNNALGLQPNDTAAINGLIKANTLSEDYKEAQRLIDDALKQYPDNAEYVLRQGIIYNLKSDHEKALEEFNKALSLNPNERLTLQILLNKASAEIRLEDLKSALEDYNKAIEIDPRNANIYSYRGLVNFRLGYYLDAVNDYNSAIDLEPNSPLTYYNRGMTYFKLGEKQKACIDFHKACKMGNINACKMIITECNSK